MLIATVYDITTAIALFKVSTFIIRHFVNLCPIVFNVSDWTDPLIYSYIFLIEYFCKKEEELWSFNEIFENVFEEYLYDKGYSI